MLNINLGHCQYNNYSILDANDDIYKLKANEVLIPVAIVAGASLFNYVPQMKVVRNQAQNVLSAHKHITKVDDYLQYAAPVSAYVLNFCGVNGKHNFIDRTLILGMSTINMVVIVNALKYSLKIQRPDKSMFNSFPSGHTATAFMGAEFLYQEYKDSYPIVAYSGYVVATSVAFLRVYNNKHWLSDVVAGASIGILSTKLAYWLFPKVCNFRFKNQKVLISSLPYYDGISTGISLTMSF